MENKLDTRQTKPATRKFLAPPVKVACLECRAARTRCNGKQPCANCTNRGCECVYTASKRGGARRRKKLSSGAGGRISSPPTNELLTGPPQIVSLASPGAGLLQQDESLGFDADFDFMPDVSVREEHFPGTGSVSPQLMEDKFELELVSPVVRVYSCNEDIISAYYCFIHPYFPVLPPPSQHQSVDNAEIGLRESNEILFHSKSNPEFQPTSPMTLAISALLALIPHPLDPMPDSQESILLRRDQAQVFAQLAHDGVEIENELIESMIDPGEALSIEPSPVSFRTPAHKQVRLEAESTIALLLLSTYEYSQRGNIAKLRKRAGQALVSAMDLGLHSKGSDDYVYAESDRRIWWMTYVCVCQGSILSCMAPSILLSDPRFTTPMPTFSSDSGAWSSFLEAQRVIATATQFVSDLESTVKQNPSNFTLWDRMSELERMIEPLVEEAETWSYTTSTSNPFSTSESVERDVARNLRLMARIKLNSARIKVHRYCAFSDMPVFTKKHCDLSSDPTAGQGPPRSMGASNCGCSNDLQQASLALNNTSNNFASPAASDDSSMLFDSPIFPFSGRFSSKVCMQSAFNIAKSFQGLSFPIICSTNISYGYQYSYDGISANKEQELPRMMPIFACCAMQASYAMIMLCHRTLAIKQSSPLDEALQVRTDNLLGKLHEGVGAILDALRNYSIANEALTGMRDQIQMAMMSVAKAQVQSRAQEESFDFGANGNRNGNGSEDSMVLM